MFFQKSRDIIRADMEKISYGFLSAGLEIPLDKPKYGNDHATGRKGGFFSQIIFIHIDQFGHDRIEQMHDDIVRIDRRIEAFAKYLVKKEWNSPVIFGVEQQVMVMIGLFVNGVDKKA